MEIAIPPPIIAMTMISHTHHGIPLSSSFLVVVVDDAGRDDAGGDEDIPGK